MADELTPNYGLLAPKSTDTMSQNLTPTVPGLVQNIRDTFERIESAANPTIVASTLPQAGSYNIGDRVYLTSFLSSFILIAKDSNWGWIWRPVQAAISPWTNVGTGAFSGPDASGYVTHPTAPLAFALDNKGNCYWRGAIRKSVLGLPNTTSLAILNTLPNGLKHHSSGFYTVAIDPATPQSDTGVNGYKGGRWYIQPNGYNDFRFFNASSAQDFYVGGIEYVCSSLYYYNP